MYSTIVKPLSLAEAIDNIKPHLLSNKMVIFVGSGVSVPKPSNLPTWDGLMEQFIEFCKKDIIPYLDKNQQDDFMDLLSDAEKIRQNYPARVASALKEELKHIQSTSPLNADVNFQRWLIRLFSGKQFNVNHELIVKTNYQHIVTSNYDDLLEEASKALNLGLHLNSYSYKQPKEIASALYNEKTSIIHIHGTFDNIPMNEIVFTHDDYIKIKIANAGFRLALSNLFASNSILFVGYGSSDPHLEDFIDEIGYHFGWANASHADLPLPRYFLALHRDKVNHILTKHKLNLRTNIVSLNDYDEMTTLLQELQAIAPR